MNFFCEVGDGDRVSNNIDTENNPWTIEFCGLKPSKYLRVLLYILFISNQSHYWYISQIHAHNQLGPIIICNFLNKFSSSTQIFFHNFNLSAYAYFIYEGELIGFFCACDCSWWDDIHYMTLTTCVYARPHTRTHTFLFYFLFNSISLFSSF